MLSLILKFLNLGFLVFLALKFKEENFFILGGTFLFIIIISFLSLFSSLFRRQRDLLQTLIAIVVCVSGWQYLNYYEVNRLFDHDLVGNLFTGVAVIIYILFLYICLNPLQPKKDLLDKNTYKNKRVIYNSIFFRIYFYSFAACAFSWMSGVAIRVTKGSYLVRNNILSVVPVGLFVLVVMNIAIYLMMTRIPDDYFKSLYHKRDISLSKAIKFTMYLLSILFIIGGIFEILTRRSLLLFIESCLFIVSLLLVVWRIYKLESKSFEVATGNIVDQAIVDTIKVDYSFYIRYILIFTAIGSAGLISFILFLSWFKP